MRRKASWIRETVNSTSGGRIGGIREHPYFIDVQAEEDAVFLKVSGELAMGKDYRRQLNI